MMTFPSNAKISDWQYYRSRNAAEQERQKRGLRTRSWGGTDVRRGDWSNWSGGPGGPVIARNPISSLDREGRLARMAREAGAPIPQDVMPPIASRQDPTMGYRLPEGASIDNMNRVVDENGIPMTLSSAGWMKDMRFYRPDGTLIGMM